MTEECPFTYPEGEEPKQTEHEIIGQCKYCDSGGHFIDFDGEISCFPCGYSNASWGLGGNWE